ncbi:unnamed protein product [Brassica rapa]|uniref:Uncharacterized protein n=1 Tax=Brassica campestris TaxID=3711 RepID=A0A8D9DFM9_BRACM|nr:unnamed protein product [Brassica rapa]
MIRCSQAEGPLLLLLSGSLHFRKNLFLLLFFFSTAVAVDGKSVVTVEFQRQKAKRLQEYFKQKKLEAAAQGPFFGFQPKNEISNGRWAMFGFAVGYATGSDLKLIEFDIPTYNYRKRRKSPSIILLPLLAFLRLKLLDTLRAAGAIRSSPDEHDDAADENSYGGGYNNGGLTILDEHQAQFGGDGLISGGVGQVGDDDGFSISFD